MFLYRPCFEHDIVLEAWYHRLRETGDLQRTFLPDAHCLSGFLGCFRPPVAMFLDIDDQHALIFAMWFQPIMGGAMAGLWIAKEKRGSKRTYANTLKALDLALEQYHVVFGITKQADLLEPHRQIGRAHV